DDIPPDCLVSAVLKLAFWKGVVQLFRIAQVRAAETVKLDPVTLIRGRRSRELPPRLVAGQPAKVKVLVAMDGQLRATTLQLPKECTVPGDDLTWCRKGRTALIARESVHAVEHALLRPGRRNPVSPHQRDKPETD